MRKDVFRLDDDRDIFLLKLLPWMAAPIKNARVVETDRRGTLVLLAVEAHRARYGDVPDTIKDLVPEFLDDVPVAPISGMPFLYRRLTDDAHGREYVLYSVGLNGSDDGGVGSFKQRVASALLMDYSDQDVDYIINVIGRSPDD